MKEEEVCPAWDSSVKQNFGRFCRACLSSDRQLSSLGENQALFNYLLNRDCSLDLSMILLCCKCQAVLTETRRFQHRIQKIHDIMQNLSTSKISYLSLEDSELVVIYTSDDDINEEKPIKSDNEYDSSSTDIAPSAVSSLSDKEEKPSFGRKLMNEESNEEEIEVHTSVGVSAMHEEPGSVVKNEETSEDEAEGAAAEHTGDGDAGEEQRVLVTADDNLTTTDVHMKRQAATKETQAQQHSYISNTSDNDENVVVPSSKDKRFSQTHKLNLLTHTGDKPTYRCAVCDKRYKLKGRLVKHLRTHAVDRPTFKCAVCGKIYKQKATLVIHLRTHTGVKPYQCEVCGRGFIDPGGLRSHSLSHTGEKHHKCKLCDKRYRYKRDVAKHSRIHTGVKPYQCDVCDKRFLHKGDLVKHLAIHAHDKPYKCEVCDKRFTQKYSLVLHLQCHTGDKRYKCEVEVCDKSFAVKSALVKHLRWHTGEKPHKCEVCDRRFCAKSDLVNHLRTHTGEKPYQCDVCGKRFALSQSLRTHTNGKTYIGCPLSGKSRKRKGVVPIRKSQKLSGIVKREK